MYGWIFIRPFLFILVQLARLFSAVFSIVLLAILMYLLVLLRFPNLLAYGSQIWKRHILFGYYRNSAMQINWFYSDCNCRYICCTNFFELHCAFLFYSFAVLLLVLLLLLECAGEFRLCGGDHGLCPLDSHKPLKRLDRNFYMGCGLYFLKHRPQ